MSAATDSIDIGHQLKPDFGPLNSFLPDESLPQAVAIQAPEFKADIESEVPASEENEESKREKKEQLRVVLAPLDYLASLPGKGFRGELMSTFNQWFKIPDEKLEIIKNIVGLLHTASLLIDDIQDSSKLRRGFPVAHSIFGVAQTINSANYAYFQAQHDLLKLGKPESFQAYTEELLSLHHGQGMDLHWRDSLVCPTEGQYLDMVSNKTGGLFRLAIRLIQLESESDLDCVPLVDLLGVIFQIRDDYQNLQSTLYAENKGFGEDITEGKFSYPIIHSISSTPNNPQLLNILRQKTEDDNVKKYAISIIESTGSLAYCREKITKLVAEARDLLQAMPIEEENMKGVQQILGFLDLSKSS